MTKRKNARFIPSQRIKGSGKELFVINYEGSTLEIQRSSNLYEPLIIRLDGELLETVPSKQNKEIEFATAEGKHTLQVWNERVENNLIPKIFVKDGIAIVIDGVPVKNSLADPMSRFGSAQAFIWLLTILLFIKGFVIPLLNIEGIKESQILILVFLYIILFILTLSAAITFKLNPLRSTWIAMVISIIESVEFFYSVVVTREFSILIVLFAVLRLSIISALIFSLRNLKHILNYEQDEVKTIKPYYSSEKKSFRKRFPIRPKYVIIVLVALIIVSGLYYGVTEFFRSSKTPSIERDSSLEVRTDLKLPDLIPYRKGDKWGYANNKGEIVVKPEYSEVEFPSKNIFFRVERDTLWGILNGQGKEIIPCIYKYIDELSKENLFIAVNSEEKRGIIDKSNKIVIPFEYNEIQETTEQNLFIAYKGHYGVIDKENNVIIDFQYTFLNFSDEFILAHKIIKDQFLYGLLNFDGSILLNFSETELQIEKQLKSNLLVASYRKVIYNPILSDYAIGPVSGIIDKNGETILSFEPGRITAYYDYYYSTLSRLDYFSNKYKQGLINAEGKIIIPCEYDYIYAPKSDDKYILVRNNEFYGVVNIQGSEIFPTKYKSIEIFRQGDRYYFSVKDNYKKKIGLLDENLDTKIPFEYESIDVCSYNLNWIIAKKDGRYGVIDFNNNIIIPFTFTYIKDLSEGLSAVKYSESDSLIKFSSLNRIKNQWALRIIHDYLIYTSDYKYKDLTYIELSNAIIDSTFRRHYYDFNKEYLEDVYGLNRYEDFCISIFTGEFTNHWPGKFGYFSSDGKKIIDFLYDDIENFENGIAKVKYNDKWGVINKKGQVVIPIIFEEIKRVKDYDLFRIEKKDKNGYSEFVGFIDVNCVEYFED